MYLMMKDFPLDRYRFYFKKRKGDNYDIIAVSTFAGKEVRGIAKCGPEDEFNLEFGKKLAAARCNAKIAHKRKELAKKKFNKAVEATILAEGHEHAMAEYLADSINAYDFAIQQINDLLGE